ncbi:MAG: non-hydrolyzing UDP-N-acetylglucosamine 2-epimerase [Candidatus Zixiibacteriota bacterium]
MKMLKVLTIFGTRPEAIKMAPVIKELKMYPKKIKVTVCVTAQHRQLLDQVLNLFNINADYDLNLMEEDQNLFELSSKLIVSLERILRKEKPDVCLVQGDTTSAFLAGLAAFYYKVKVGHIEAGLRTYNKYHPFPEEVNRHLLSVLTDFHFAPTEEAKKNLLLENIPTHKIFVTGNTVIDALLSVVEDNYEFHIPALKKIDFTKRIILVTLHRRESFGKPFEEMCLALKKLKSENGGIEIVYPVHLNPNVQKPVNTILKGKDGIHLVRPLDYKNFVQLLNKSYLVLTDSGGIQEEAPSLGKPVLVMRETTERPEAVLAGTAEVVGTKMENLIAKVNQLLNSKGDYDKMANATNPFGDGKAAQRIVEILSKNYKQT